jgi:lysophospholipase L1-like esterase
VKVAAADSVLEVTDASDPQMTVVGDSYQLANSATFGNGSAIALELGARLGIGKIAVDGVGGTGYYNSGLDFGSLNDRLAAQAADGSSIYLVVAGLNDYANLLPGGQVEWPTGAAFEESVHDYLQGLRQARPDALIIVTAPFCPVPPQSDASHVANAATNASGMGDFLYKSSVQRAAVEALPAPWIWIDSLMGTGWRNSSGASGDATGLQWLTGGTPAPGTTAAYKPGNTGGGGGGGFGGIAHVPIVSGGQYSQAPEVRVAGGSGAGAQFAARIDTTGALSLIDIIAPGSGFTADTGLPTVTLDERFAITPALLGAPTLITGINPTGEYPLPAFAPPGATDLNNIYKYLSVDTVHPSPPGVSYLAGRLAENIYAAIMSL